MKKCPACNSDLHDNSMVCPICKYSFGGAKSASQNANTSNRHKTVSKTPRLGDAANPIIKLLKIYILILKITKIIHIVSTVAIVLAILFGIPFIVDVSPVIDAFLAILSGAVAILITHFAKYIAELMINFFEEHIVIARKVAELENE